MNWISELHGGACISDWGGGVPRTPPFHHFFLEAQQNDRRQSIVVTEALIPLVNALCEQTDK